MSQVHYSRREQIETLLRAELTPTHLDVIDESVNHHHGHEHLGAHLSSDEFMSAGTHMKAIVVSPKFIGLTRVKRQQLVYKALGSLFDEGLHALSLTTFTPDEWNSGARANESPACAGAAKSPSR